MEECRVGRVPKHIAVRKALCISEVPLIPPIGMVVALRLDGRSPGPLSDASFFVLPILGLLILLPQLSSWPIRLLFAVIYVCAELVMMFVVGAPSRMRMVWGMLVGLPNTCRWYWEFELEELPHQI